MEVDGMVRDQHHGERRHDREPGGGRAEEEVRGHADEPAEARVGEEAPGLCDPRDDEVLGIDPLFVANEGKLVAVVAPEAEARALAALRAHPLGVRAAAIGTIEADPEHLVVLDTAFGGARIVDMLVGDPLPRIC